MDEVARVDVALAALRARLDEGIEPGGAERPVVVDEPSVVNHPGGSAEDPEWLTGRISELEPWSQGPFPLVPGVVAGEAGDDGDRWLELARWIGDDLGGELVLDVGCAAGYDAFQFAHRGARKVLGCEWSSAIEQALFVEQVYASGVEFIALPWEQLDPDVHGRFDLVHCNGVLQRVESPVNLLGRLWRMLRPGGVLLLGSALIDVPRLSQHAAFVSTDAGLGWLPGRLALRWLVETAGFEPGEWLAERAGRKGDRPTVHSYLRAARSDRQPAILPA